MRHIIIRAATALAVLWLGIIPASAQDCTGTITIPSNTVRVGDPGDTFELARETLPAGCVGLDAEVTLTSFNPDSVHPGNDLTFYSDGDSLTAFDVEREEAFTLEVPGVLTLGSEFRVVLTLGDGDIVNGFRQQRFSGGFTITWQPATTTTTTTEVPPSDTTTTTQPTTTTTTGTTTTTSSTSVPTTSTDSPTTTVPSEPPASSTVVPPSSTSTSSVPVATTQPTTTTTTGQPELPATGLGLGVLAGIGGFLGLAGVGALWAGRVDRGRR